MFTIMECQLLITYNAITA